VSARALAAGAALAAAALGACAGAPTPTAAPGPALPPARAAFVAALDSMLDAPQWRTARWGVLIVHPRTGDTLYARDADRLFMPASNQKLVTGATALAVLGPDYRWRTAVAAPRGAFRDGVVRGDLHVVGSGDPTVSDRMRGDAMIPLLALADTLRARGLRRVEGELVASGGAFPGDYWGYGWGWDDFDEPYSAGVSELLLNDGLARVVVRGGPQPGSAPEVAVGPAAGIVPLELAVTTATPGVVGRGTTATRVTARWNPRRCATGWRVWCRWATAPCSPSPSAIRAAPTRRRSRRRSPSAASPCRRRRGGAARALCLGTGLRPAHAARHGGRDVVAAAARGAPGAREAVAEPDRRGGVPLARLRAHARRHPRQRAAVVYEQLRQWNVVPEQDIAVRDGSGLSRHDYVTPRALVRILDAVRRRPDSSAFIDALPVAGVDGTLANRMKGTPAEGNVRAKTGTVDRARALSGYVTTADGERLVFSLLCNNHTVPTREVDRVQDAIAARLAAMRVSAFGAPALR
jgi:D-alanyl-D-alanine carboxypeptidase/D-alanyl-D-alanine-endopeptidase (penicillin-binding protein 4)